MEKSTSSMVTMVLNTLAVHYNLSDQARKKLLLESVDTQIMLSTLDTPLFEKISRRIEHWAHADQDYFEQDQEVLDDYRIR